MDIYPGKEGTVTISVERFKELEEKEQALDSNKIMITFYKYGIQIYYYNKEDVLPTLTKELEDSNTELQRRMDDCAYERIVWEQKVRDIGTALYRTKNNKPSLLDRIRWDFKNTPLANV